ncbi:MAG: hypothetical protein ACJ74W_09300 [Pyrinomonadaceae bacterium]
MRHFLLMVGFALAVSIVFGTTGREDRRTRLLYGVKIFAEFIGIGLALGWLLYWLPY